jgi:hypothetical protein
MLVKTRRIPSGCWKVTPNSTPLGCALGETAPTAHRAQVPLRVIVLPTARFAYQGIHVLNIVRKCSNSDRFFSLKCQFC